MPHNYTIPTWRAAFSAAIGLVIAACSQNAGHNAHNHVSPSDRAPTHSTELKAAAPSSSTPLQQSRFTAITPDLQSASTFNYKVFEFADDGSWISVVPMPPKAGEVVIRVNIPGHYEVRLENSKCASSVNVSPSDSLPFDLSTNNPKHLLAVDGGLQLKIAMPDNAPNNYFCNVAVALTSN